MALGPRVAYVLKNLIVKPSANVSSLNLRKNFLGNQGVQLLAQGLISIERIEQLPEESEINDSQLSNDETLGTCFSENTVTIQYPVSQIVSLDLGENDINHIGAKHLFEALKKNQTIVSLNIGNIDSV